MSKAVISVDAKPYFHVRNFTVGITAHGKANTKTAISASSGPVFGREESITPWLPASFHFPKNIVAFMRQYSAKDFITWIVVFTSSRTYK